MQRTILKDLRKWKDSKRRKPLIIKGARQVGKTWVLKEFGKEFPDGYAYFNFDREPEYAQFFSSTKDTERILKNLALASGQKITKNTLIIFDEIQACEDALNALKYFCEDAPDYYIACAGSLLGLQLSKGYPVGKVNMLRMYPMAFTEFLMADGNENLVTYLQKLCAIEAIPDAFFNPLCEELKRYYIIGGMPEAVSVWVDEHNIKAVEQVQADILDAYESDFGKHAPIEIVPKIKLIWDSLPSQLARENKKFLYSVVKAGARAREYEDALNWLCNADLTGKVFRITKPGLPLSSYDDLGAFKIFMVDVGLLRKHSHLAYSAFAEENRLFTEFKGALTENYVYEALLPKLEVEPRYWSELSNAEIDFVIQLDNDILPVEAKAGTNVKATSIKKYAKEFAKSTPLIIRASLKNLSLDGNVLNVPLFLMDELPRLVSIALKLI